MSSATHAESVRASRPLPVRIWLPVGVALALVAGMAAWLIGSAPASRNGYHFTPISDGTPAPPFTLPGLRGGTVSLDALRGRPVVVNFFASDCRFCRAELRTLAAGAGAAGARVDFVGVDVEDPSPQQAAALLSRAGATYPVGVDARGDTAAAYGIQGLPTTVFIDAAGRVTSVHIGAETAASLRAGVAGAAQGG
jgi:cytochrome c biogenesis protein CcmG/thiol:disulfide interchange protein DsbE